ncbi:hypothetical protein Tco_1472450 [Tanacetum coccineum]
MEKKPVIARLNKVSSPDGDYLVIYRANRNFRAFNYLMEGDLKIMMESSTEGNEQICILEFEDGIVIHMLVERRYPLFKDLLQMMLDLSLEVERESSVALDVVNGIEKGFSTHLASLVKSWLVQDQTVLALASPKANELTIPEQTATGKGTSNPFMAGSLPKTTKPT